MYSLLFIIAARNSEDVISGVDTITKTYDVGIYKFTLNAAAGGVGCFQNTIATFGGHGAQVEATLNFSQKTNVHFIIGKKGIYNSCERPQLGGYPNGGIGGKDSWNNGSPGGGGGMTAIKINNELILAAGAGAGGSGNFNGSHGGGFGYIVRVTENILEQNVPKTIQEAVYTDLNKYIESGQNGGAGEWSSFSPGSGGGGGWFGGKGGKAGSKNEPKICGVGGMSGYLSTSHYFVKTPLAKDGRFTSNTEDGSAIVRFIQNVSTIPERKRKPRKILATSSMVLSLASTNLF